MKVSESFYSVQGEGISSGVPSYFIRLQGCNLMCGGKDGRLVDEGKATWHCDTEEVWRKGNNYSNEHMTDKINEEVGLERILNGDVHMIWTGGEPLLAHHQRDIYSFLQHLDVKSKENNIYNEIETNGTILFNPELYSKINQINCSPKLSNSGMSESDRINPESINQIKEHYNPWFKFVISNESDINEIEKDYVEPFNLAKSSIILMPGVDNLNDLSERTRFVYEMTKKHGYRSCTRGQILAWDKVTGV